jgi:uncharacterized protein YbaR (Trm112 family)
MLPGLARYADSIYVEAGKKGGVLHTEALHRFGLAHAKNPADNLNLVHLLQCPVSAQALCIADDRQTLRTADGSLSYPVVEGIPVLISSEAKTA